MMTITIYSYVISYCPYLYCISVECLSNIHLFHLDNILLRSIEQLVASKYVVAVFKIAKCLTFSGREACTGWCMYSLDVCSSHSKQECANCASCYTLTFSISFEFLTPSYNSENGI